MKKIMILALASTAFSAAMIGFSEKAAAEDIEIPAIESNMRTLDLRVTAFVDFDGRGEGFNMIRSMGFATLGPAFDNNISSLRIQPGMRVEFFDDSNFRNGFRTIMNSGDQARLVNLSGDWNDRISSLRVAPITGDEFGVSLFEHPNQTGRVVRHTSPANNFNLMISHNFNDLTSAIELFPNTRIVLFEHFDHRGQSIRVENRGNEMMNVSLEGTPWNDRISSYQITRIN